MRLAACCAPRKPYRVWLQRLLRLLDAGCRLTCGLRDAHAFFRREQGHEDVAFHARHRLNLPLVANLHEQAVHLGAADFLMRHFAPAMKIIARTLWPSPRKRMIWFLRT